MSGRFRSFSFVDRITRRDGGRVEGHYTLPLGVHFPASLMAEAVGQLAAWSSMAQLDFACRPVAGLVGRAGPGRSAAHGLVGAHEAERHGMAMTGRPDGVVDEVEAH